MTTVSDNIRSAAAQELRHTVEKTCATLQLIEEMTNNIHKWDMKDSRNVAEILLELWESNEIYGALTEYIETLAG